MPSGIEDQDFSMLHGTECNHDCNPGSVALQHCTSCGSLRYWLHCWRTSPTTSASVRGMPFSQSAVAALITQGCCPATSCGHMQVFHSLCAFKISYTAFKTQTRCVAPGSLRADLHPALPCASRYYEYGRPEACRCLLTKAVHGSTPRLYELWASS